MNKSTFTQLINNPTSISDKDMKAVDELAKNFPYCQYAHILSAKAHHDQDSVHANQKLKIASAYTSSRKNLKKLILLK